MAEEKQSESIIIAKPNKPQHPIQCHNYINGEFVPPHAKAYLDVFSPHDVSKVSVN